MCLALGPFGQPPRHILAEQTAEYRHREIVDR
jgi:hypothetical protein